MTWIQLALPVREVGQIPYLRLYNSVLVRWPIFPVISSRTADSEMVSRERITAMYHQYRNQVWRYLRRQTGSVDAAEDLCQEVFLRIVAGIDSYDARGFDRAWVFQIARRVLIDRERNSEPTTIPLGADAPIDAGAEPVQLLRVSLDEALQRISSIDRDVLLLREATGLTPPEIASVTGLSVAAVKNRLVRTRRWLKDVVVFGRRSRRSPVRREVTP